LMNDVLYLSQRNDNFYLPIPNFFKKDM